MTAVPNFSAQVAFPVLIALIALLVIFIFALAIMVQQAHQSDFVKLNTQDQFFRKFPIKGDKQVDRNIKYLYEYYRGSSIWAPFVVALLALIGYVVAYAVAMNVKPTPQQVDLSDPNVALYCWGFGISIGVILLFMLIGTLKTSSCRNGLDCTLENPNLRKSRQALGGVAIVISLAILGVSIAGIVLVEQQKQTASVLSV